MQNCISRVAMVICLFSGMAGGARTALGDIDQTGWAQILIDPATQKPIPTLNGFYTGYGVMAVFGQDARILALYAADADHKDSDAERRGSKLITSAARDEYLAMRKGPSVAASMLGKGRLVVVALDPWFDGVDQYFNGPDKKKKKKERSAKKKKNAAPENTDYPAADATFLKNACSWLTGGKSLASIEIISSEPSFTGGVGKVTPWKEGQLKAQLMSADLFFGRVNQLREDELDALLNFVEQGGAVFTGTSPDKRADDDKRGWYAYPIADQKGLFTFNQKINRLLRPAGLGIAYGVIDGKESRQRLDTHVPVQWGREYGADMLSAIDVLHAVHKEGDHAGIQVKTSPDFRPVAGQDPVVAVATLIGQQVFAMGQILSADDPLRVQLEEKLVFLNETENRTIKGPLQKGLSMVEAVSLFKRSADTMQKSKLADSLLGWKQPPEARMYQEPFPLTLGRDRVQITEFYAPAGEKVTLDFSDSPDLVGQGFYVHINVENSYNFFSEVNFLRPPLFQQAVLIDQPIVHIASPYGGIVYIRYGQEASEAEMKKAGSVAEQEEAEAAILLGEGVEQKERFAKISGAMRYPCFISGKHNNADWAAQLAEFPGYKVGAICRNVWLDIPRQHIEEFALKDIETWAMQFDASYGRSFEVGPSIKVRTTRLTDRCIPGREPGMPTRMGRMSSVDRVKCSIASVEGEGGMTAHKVGHGIFGPKYSWARAIGTGVEFRANQMKWYEEYKKGKANVRSSKSWIGSEDEHIPYSPYDAYGIIKAFGQFLSEQGGSYFSVMFDDAVMHKESGGKGTPHMPFLYAKWMYDFDGQHGVNVWAKMNKQFADDVQAERDDDPKTVPSYPLRKGDAHLHAEDHAVRWAQISGYNIIPYFEVFGFKISASIKNMDVIKQAQSWLPMASRYFNQAEEMLKDTQTTFDFSTIDDTGMTVALSKNGEAVLPEFLGITQEPAFGTFKKQAGNVYVYAPASAFVGRDSFAYKVRHPGTQQEQVFTIYIQVLAVASVIEPTEALKRFGRGALVEVYQEKTGSILSGKKPRRKGRKGSTAGDPQLQAFSTLAETMVPQSSHLSIQGFESTTGVNGFCRIRAYLDVPEDGDYTFWVASYSDAILRINPNGADPAGAQVILEAAAGPSLPLIFTSDGGVPNKTAPISLQQGMRYYVDLARGFSDRPGLWLGWSRDPAATEPDEVIPNDYLIPVGQQLAFVPVDDQVNTVAGQSVLIDALANDQDFRFQDSGNTECLQISFVGQSENGHTELIGTRHIKYTPKLGFTGIEKFQYAIQSTTYRDRMRVGSVTVKVE